MIEAPATVEALAPWQQLGLAAGLLALAAALLALELFVVSWGLLTVAAAAAAVAACVLAFQVSAAAGWLFIAGTPLIAYAVLRWGLRRLAASRLVVTQELVGDAGYHSVADRVGAKPGALGDLVTDALPTGRARFSGGEVDVQVEGGHLARGARVIVLRTDGPVVTVAASPANASSPQGAP